MTNRAPSSGISLSEADAALVKSMLLRGDRQHDVAAWFGVNGGRIGEISKGLKFSWVKAESADQLPPPGPYLAARDVAVALSALSSARKALDQAEVLLQN